MKQLARRHGLKAALARRDGATALEFGLIGVMFCLLILGVFELSRYFYTYQAIRTVAAEAARRVQVDQTLGYNAGGAQVCQTDTSIDINVRERTALNPNGLSVCYTRTNNNGVNTITVTVSYPFRFSSIGVLNDIFGTTNYTLSETTQTTTVYSAP